MAKKDSTAVAEREKPGALVRPDFIKAGDTRGTEKIGNDDVRPPSIRIAQSMSPEVKRQEDAYIEGLREGEFFNSITREVYGEDPINLIIVRSLGHRHVEFEPGNQGTVIDFDVPDGDPRTQFTEAVVDGAKKRVKPRATKFYDYLVGVITTDADGNERRELMAMSLKSTQLKKAVRLNTLLAGSQVPSFAHLFKASVTNEKRGNNSFYGWRFDPLGWVSEEQYAWAEAQFETFKDTNIDLKEATTGDDTPADGDDIPF